MSVQPIFLLSLPRSGSTLLQRVISRHPAIATVAEPWILLAPLYAMRRDGVFAEYGHETSVVALEGFWRGLPGGRADYLSEVREMALRLYEKASGPGARYFLDKTPRYSLVLDELFETFPDAKAIFLWRNPLAVVASIVDTWFEGRWAPHRHHVDLYTGLGKLVAARDKHASSTIGLRYEDLVTQPATTLRSVLDYLGLEWEEAVVSDLRTARVDGAVGDQVGIHRYSNVSRESIDRWKTTLAAPVRRAWCRRYLEWIGDERMAVMGYDGQVLRKELDALPTTATRLVPDLLSTAKSVLSLAVEPPFVRSKLRRLRQPKAVHLHD